MNDIICELCGKNSNLQTTVNGYQEPSKFKIYQCDSCNTSFSIPRVYDSNELYNNIYQNAKILPGYSRYWNYANEITSSESPLKYLADSEGNYWAVKELLDSETKEKKNLKILEVGSGLGYLTYALKKDGYNVLGLDISKVAVEQACEKFGNNYVCDDVFEFSKKNLAFFDIIILNEVIEHVNEPLNFIKALKDLLVDSGLIIITTPNKSFYPKDIIWATDYAPVHCWWFSEDSFIFMSKKLNLKIDFFDFTNFYKDNFFPINFEYFRNRPLPISVFNAEGGLNEPLYIKKKGLIFNLIKNIYYSFPLFQKLIWLLKEKFNKNLTHSTKRGPVLCAILKKQA